MLRWGGTVIVNSCCPGGGVSSELYVYPTGGACAIMGQRIPISWDGTKWTGTDSTACHLTYTLQCLSGLWQFAVYDNVLRPCPISTAGETQTVSCGPPFVLQQPVRFLSCCSCVGGMTFTIMDVWEHQQSAVWVLLSFAQTCSIAGNTGDKIVDLHWFS